MRRWRRGQDVHVEIRSLEAFIAFAEELHFGRAARRIHMAQSPLSQVIRKLEREIGTSLFDRGNRTVALTAAGHALLPHARKVVEEVDLGKRATVASSGELYGTVAIGFSGVLNHQTLGSSAWKTWVWWHRLTIRWRGPCRST